MAATSIDLSGSTLTVYPHGQLNADVAAELRPQIRRHVAEGARSVVFDCSHVDAVDSSGIGLIVATFNSVHKAGGEFSVSGASVEVRKVLAAMRLDRHFRIDGSAAGAAP
jgi:anti-anti-sigma factor